MRDEIMLERCDSGMIVEKNTYITGLLDVVDYLITELKQQLGEENRYFGIVTSYFNSFSIAYDRIYKTMPEEDFDIYGRILYLFKPSLRSEFSFLTKIRNLSPADACIVIVRKITQILLEVGEDHQSINEIRTLNKIITKLFDNIRGRGKDSALFNFSNSVRVFINSGKVGKFCLEQFSFTFDKKNNELLKQSGVRIKDDSDDKIIEITL